MDSYHHELALQLDANAPFAGSLDEAHALRSMLPICSWCRRIRDGRGLWQQVEQYLSKHADDTLTHGICPECESLIFRDGDLYAPPEEV